jgi:hypothetical protein
LACIPVHRLFCILLLVCLPLQSFAAQFGGARAMDVTSVSHSIDHLLDQHHHHHEGDGEIHYDDSAESNEHSHEHSHTCQLFLIKPPSIVFAQPAPLLTRGAEQIAYIPHPYLDGPQRPPAFAPGHAAGG